MKFHLNQNYKLLGNSGTLLVIFLKSPQWTRFNEGDLEIFNEAEWDIEFE
jgi:hypothetical protein